MELLLRCSEGPPSSSISRWSRSALDQRLGSQRRLGRPGWLLVPWTRGAPPGTLLGALGELSADPRARHEEF